MTFGNGWRQSITRMERENLTGLSSIFVRRDRARSLHSGPRTRNRAALWSDDRFLVVCVKAARSVGARERIRGAKIVDGRHSQGVGDAGHRLECLCRLDTLKRERPIGDAGSTA
jgi:hypothetical protein